MGLAGSGKSLTTRLKILSELDSKRLSFPIKQFEVIVYITGREQTQTTTKDIHELWRSQEMGFSSQKELFILNHFSRHSSKVLFLVDGWDEAGDDRLVQEDSVLNKIPHGELYSESVVIITSRPSLNA